MRLLKHVSEGRPADLADVLRGVDLATVGVEFMAMVRVRMVEVLRVVVPEHRRHVLTVAPDHLVRVGNGADPRPTSSVAQDLPLVDVNLDPVHASDHTLPEHLGRGPRELEPVFDDEVAGESAIRRWWTFR